MKLNHVFILLSFFLLPAPANAQVTRLSADAKVFVDCVNGNDANDGSLAHPFRTQQRATDYIWGDFDLNGWSFEVQLKDGDHRPCGGATVNGLARGQAAVNRNILSPISEGVVRIKGNPGGGNNVVIQGVNASNGASIFVDNLTIQSPANGIISDRGSDVFFRNIVFASMGGNHMIAMNGGRIANYGSYSVSGAGASHIAASANGSIVIGGPVILNGASTFSVAFANAQFSGTILSTAIWNGVAAGMKYIAGFNGVIYGASVMPGAVEGSVSTGGQIGG